MSLHRRNFLKTAAIATAWPLLSSRPGVYAAAPAESKLRLGLVTYNWGKDWDLPTLLKNCEATGYAGVELRSTHKHGVEITLSESEREEVRKRFADSSVENVGLGSACEYHAADPAVVKKNIEETKAFIKLCHDIEGGGVKVRPNGLPAEVPVEKTLEQIGRSLNEVGAFAGDYGVQIRLEVHGRGTSHIPHVKTIMDIADNPNVVVCWNCNPQDLEGEGLRANYEMLANRMGTIHIHDLRKDNYPWAKLFELLKQTDAECFTGWTLMEEGTIPADLLTAMQENRTVWEKLVKG